MSASRLDQEHLRTLTVLYVEDEDDAREQFTEFLTRHVGTLLTASNGADGLDVFIRTRPHIVITDIQMPDMDGLALSEKIREVDESVPIILLTAFEPMDFLIRAAVIGVEKYISKPVDGAHMLKCLCECAQLVHEEQKSVA